MKLFENTSLILLSKTHFSSANTKPYLSQKLFLKFLFKSLIESMAFGGSKNFAAKGSYKRKCKAPLSSTEQETYKSPNVPQDPLPLKIMKSQVFIPLNHDGHHYAHLGPYEPLESVEKYMPFFLIFR